MINRILIRIKVVQMVYSYLLDQKGKRMMEAQKELATSLDKAYELYHYLLMLPVEFVRLQEERLDNARNKYLPTDEDLNPNTKFVDNLFVKKISNCEMFKEFVKDNSISWADSEISLRLMLDKIVNSDIYQEYMDKPGTSLAEDCELWRNLLKKVVFIDENLTDALETKSVYWNDDLDTVGTFVLKTIKRFEEEGYEELLPKYKDDEDRLFAEKLFVNAVNNKDEYMKLIDMFVSKDSWETERLAFMDIVVLLVAIAELEKVPSVPTKVTMNEFIEIAKCYSTNKSGQFVNGILNSIINYLKKEGRLFKN
jgi:N utilization substance protein B